MNLFTWRRLSRLEMRVFGTKTFAEWRMKLLVNI
jgi:hypothetical protein